MSRENPFAKLDLAALGSNKASTKPGYAMTGAAKTVVRSIEDLAENTKRLMEGEVIVELDPQSLDPSSISDRLSDDGEEYQELKQAIQQQGQSTPILVRPSGRREALHGRVWASPCKGLPGNWVSRSRPSSRSWTTSHRQSHRGRKIRRVRTCRSLSAHFFAQNMLSSAMSKETVRASLAIDEAMLSKMLGVVEAVSPSIIKALGASKKIGRDKWLSLRQLVLSPTLLKAAEGHASSPEFLQLPEAERFDKLLEYLKRFKTKSVAKQPKAKSSEKAWTSGDSALSLVMNAKSKKVAIELSNTEARPFSDWLSSRMDRLYDEYRQSKPDNNGD